ncbi:MAG: hypothetical protein Q4C20_13140 [Erysipelotrichaceae bacterium]|nr:hypothetical protein [Erysipelotrichaceae bacterium]
MEKTIYRKIPLRYKKNECPFCHRDSRDHKDIELLAHTKDGHTKTFKAKLPFCEQCKLPSTIGDINCRLNTLKQCSVNIVSRQGTLEEFKREITTGSIEAEKNKSVYYELVSGYHLPPDFKKSLTSFGFDFNEENINDDDNTLSLQKDLEIRLSSELAENDCAVCNNNLRNETVYLAVNPYYYLKVDGVYCDKCGLLYVENTYAIENLLRWNSHKSARKIQIGQTTYRCYFNQARYSYLANLEYQKRRAAENLKYREEEKRKQAIRDELKSIRNAVSKISISYTSPRDDYYYIVSKKDSASSVDHKLYYEDEFARELLTAAYVSSRGKTGYYNNERFLVTDVVSAEENGMSLIILEEVNIKADGGYASSVINNWQEVVNVLLYSPFSKRLEIIRATLDKEKQNCYIDMFLFRKYVESYGNPGIPYTFTYNNSSYREFDELNAESVLKSMGYNVGKKDNLSAFKRQALLKDILDLEIMTAHEIIRYLHFFIKSHPQSYNYDARKKWEDDIRCIENYKVNPERFLIAS